MGGLQLLNKDGRLSNRDAYVEAYAREKETGGTAMEMGKPVSQAGVAFGRTTSPLESATKRQTSSSCEGAARHGAPTAAIVPRFAGGRKKSYLMREQDLRS